MSHYQQLKFVEISARYLEKAGNLKSNGFKKVLEVGSWDMNGSVKGLFPATEYIGIDVASGPGVDHVILGQEADFKSNYFDIVISCECFEHNKYWVETFSNMIRMLRPGGVLLITCASVVRGEHGTPRCANNYSLTSLKLSDSYYQNLDKYDFMRTGLLKNFSIYKFMNNLYTRDIYFIGIKQGGVASIDFDLISAEVSSMIKESELSLGQDIVAKTSYYFRYIIAKILGEKRYHNLVFSLKNMNNGKSKL